MTVTGAAGGVKFIPKMADAEVSRSDVTSYRRTRSFGSSFAGWIFVYGRFSWKSSALWIVLEKYLLRHLRNKDIDVIMTVATKGIPIAHAIARHLNVPVVIVRRDSKVTEGSTVSINYVQVQQDEFKRWYYQKEA